MTFESTPQRGPVAFTPELARLLQADYDAAVAAGKEHFPFQGREYSTRYTYYLLQHLNNNRIGR